MSSNNSKFRKVERRADALSRFSIKPDKYSSAEEQAKYVSRKNVEHSSLKKG